MLLPELITHEWAVREPTGWPGRELSLPSRRFPFPLNRAKKIINCYIDRLVITAQKHLSLWKTWNLSSRWGPFRGTLREQREQIQWIRRCTLLSPGHETWLPGSLSPPAWPSKYAKIFFFTLKRLLAIGSTCLNAKFLELLAISSLLKHIVK